MSLPWLIVIIVLVLFFMGISIVRPTHRGLVEMLGKYNRFAKLGFNWIIPLGIEHLYQVNTTSRWWMPSRRKLSPTII